MTDDSTLLHVWNINEQLIKQRLIKIYTEITNESAYQITSMMDVMDFDSHDVIKIELDTPGGSIYDGMSIIQKMQEISSPVVVYINGWTASFGTVIAAAASKCYISKYATVLIHQLQQVFPAGLQQSMPDMNRLIEQNKILNDEVLTLLSNKMGMSIDELKKRTDHDWYLTAEEAVKYHLADGFTPSAKKNDKVLDDYVKHVESLNK